MIAPAAHCLGWRLNNVNELWNLRSGNEPGTARNQAVTSEAWGGWVLFIASCLFCG